MGQTITRAQLPTITSNWVHNASSEPALRGSGEPGCLLHPSFSQAASALCREGEGYEQLSDAALHFIHDNLGLFRLPGRVDDGDVNSVQHSC